MAINYLWDGLAVDGLDYRGPLPLLVVTPFRGNDKLGGKMMATPRAAALCGEVKIANVLPDSIQEEIIAMLTSAAEELKEELWMGQAKSCDPESSP